MSSIKVVKLGSGRRTDLPGGSWVQELITSKLAGSKKCMLGYSTFKPKTKTKKLTHSEEELCFVISGKGKLEVDNGFVYFEAGDALYIPPNVAHAVVNDGEDDVIMVYVFSYPEYPPTVAQD
ncbi:MAG: cupin domain-containing protein [Nitrososphaerales archaeon]